MLFNRKHLHIAILQCTLLYRALLHYPALLNISGTELFWPQYPVRASDFGVLRARHLRQTRLSESIKSLPLTHILDD